MRTTDYICENCVKGDHKNCIWYDGESCKPRECLCFIPKDEWNKRAISLTKLEAKLKKVRKVC